jgi:hypothetical protein
MRNGRSHASAQRRERGTIKRGERANEIGKKAEREREGERERERGERDKTPPP